MINDGERERSLAGRPEYAHLHHCPCRGRDLHDFLGGGLDRHRRRCDGRTRDRREQRNANQDGEAPTANVCSAMGRVQHRD